METQDTQKKGKLLRGVVVGSAAKDTAKVAVARYVKHPKYKKFIKRVKRYLVHDPGNTAATGEAVTIRESRPISKNKHFTLESKDGNAAATSSADDNE